MPDELTQIKFEHLRNLQREREQLSKKLSKLDEEIGRLTLEYGRAHNKKTPIFSLPNELILLVFKYAYYTCRFEVRDIRNDEEDLGWDHCEDDTDTNRTICNNCRTIETDISHVCHLWRVLSLGYSELWSTFNYRCRQWGYISGKIPRAPTGHLARYLQATLSSDFRDNVDPFTSRCALATILGPPGRGRFRPKSFLSLPHSF